MANSPRPTREIKKIKWVGGAFLQGGKKFAAQISLLLNGLIAV